VSFIPGAGSSGGGGDTPAPPPAPTAPVGSGLVTPVVTAVAGAPDGWATYTLTAQLGGDARSVYSVFGRSTSVLSLPAAYQEATFGANVGGVSPAFIAVSATAAFDSWLTIGETGGDAAGIGSIGIDWAAWTATDGFSTDNGAVFLTDPDSATDGDAVVGQMTVQADSTVTMGMQGRSTSGGNDWSEDNLSFSLTGGGGDVTPTPTPTPPPPAPPVVEGCTSTLTCDELGALYGGDWRTTTNNFRRGSDQVCGESDGGFMAADGTNACFGGDLHGNGSGDLGGAQNDIITDGWSHAGSICLAIGARLCTTEELQADETRGTGCGHDGEWVWSSDTCADGHLVSVGASNNGRNLCSGDGEECLPDQNPCTCNARCWASTENAGVRCCADVVGPLCNAAPVGR